MIKRYLAASLLFAAAASLVVAKCDLPESYLTTTSSTTSPEQNPPQKYEVNHNGKVLCLPAPARDAHIAHGDTGGKKKCS